MRKPFLVDYRNNEKENQHDDDNDKMHSASPFHNNTMTLSSIATLLSLVALCGMAQATVATAAPHYPDSRHSSTPVPHHYPHEQEQHALFVVHAVVTHTVCSPQEQKKLLLASMSWDVTLQEVALPDFPTAHVATDTATATTAHTADSVLGLEMEQQRRPSVLQRDLVLEWTTLEESTDTAAASPAAVNAVTTWTGQATVSFLLPISSSQAAHADFFQRQRMFIVALREHDVANNNNNDGDAAVFLVRRIVHMPRTKPIDKNARHPAAANSYRSRVQASEVVSIQGDTHFARSSSNTAAESLLYDNHETAATHFYSVWQTIFCSILLLCLLEGFCKLLAVDREQVRRAWNIIYASEMDQASLVSQDDDGDDDQGQDESDNEEEWQSLEHATWTTREERQRLWHSVRDTAGNTAASAAEEEQDHAGVADEDINSGPDDMDQEEDQGLVRPPEMIRRSILLPTVAQEMDRLHLNAEMTARIPTAGVPATFGVPNVVANSNMSHDTPFAVAFSNAHQLFQQGQFECARSDVQAQPWNQPKHANGSSVTVPSAFWETPAGHTDANKAVLPNQTALLKGLTEVKIDKKDGRLSFGLSTVQWKDSSIVDQGGEVDTPMATPGAPTGLKLPSQSLVAKEAVEDNHIAKNVAGIASTQSEYTPFADPMAEDKNRRVVTVSSPSRRGQTQKAGDVGESETIAAEKESNRTLDPKRLEFAPRKAQWGTKRALPVDENRFECLSVERDPSMRVQLLCQSQNSDPSASSPTGGNNTSLQSQSAALPESAGSPFLSKPLVDQQESPEGRSLESQKSLGLGDSHPDGTKPDDADQAKWGDASNGSKNPDATANANPAPFEKLVPSVLGGLSKVTDVELPSPIFESKVENPKAPPISTLSLEPRTEGKASSGFPPIPLLAGTGEPLSGLGFDEKLPKCNAGDTESHHNRAITDVELPSPTVKGKTESSKVPPLSTPSCNAGATKSQHNGAATVHGAPIAAWKSDSASCNFSYVSTLPPDSNCSDDSRNSIYVPPHETLVSRLVRKRDAGTSAGEAQFATDNGTAPPANPDTQQETLASAQKRRRVDDEHDDDDDLLQEFDFNVDSIPLPSVHSFVVDVQNPVLPDVAPSFALMSAAQYVEAPVWSFGGPDSGSLPPPPPKKRKISTSKTTNWAAAVKPSASEGQGQSVRVKRQHRPRRSGRNTPPLEEASQSDTLNRSKRAVSFAGKRPHSKTSNSNKSPADTTGPSPKVDIKSERQSPDSMVDLLLAQNPFPKPKPRRQVFSSRQSSRNSCAAGRSTNETNLVDLVGHDDLGELLKNVE